MTISTVIQNPLRANTQLPRYLQVMMTLWIGVRRRAVAAAASFAGADVHRVFMGIPIAHARTREGDAPVGVGLLARAPLAARPRLIRKRFLVIFDRVPPYHLRFNF